MNRINKVRFLKSIRATSLHLLPPMLKTNKALPTESTALNVCLTSAKFAHFAFRASIYHLSNEASKSGLFEQNVLIAL